MKKFVEAEVVELNVNETAHNWLGIYRDGGYIGDGEISGHLQWSDPNAQPTDPTNLDNSEISNS